MTNEKGAAPDHIIATPIWVLVVRVFQFLLALIILGLSGTLIHQAYLDENGLALAISLFTWIIVGYIVLTEKISPLHAGYNIIAVLVLDGFLVILWLATFAAVAAERARYVVPVNVHSCFDDGSLVSSNTCTIGKRSNVILWKSGRDMMSAIAGLGALNWLLFIATFVWTLVTFLRARKEGRFQSIFGHSESSPESGNYQMESKPQPVASVAAVPQEQPLQQQPTGQYPPPAGSYPVNTYPSPQDQYPQGQYPAAGYPQQQQQPYPQQYPQQGTVSPPSMSPAPQQSLYQPPQELHGQQPEQPQQQGQYPPQAYYPQQPQQ